MPVPGGGRAQDSRHVGSRITDCNDPLLAYLTEGCGFPMLDLADATSAHFTENPGKHPALAAVENYPRTRLL